MSSSTDTTSPSALIDLRDTESNVKKVAVAALIVNVSACDASHPVDPKTGITTTSHADGVAGAGTSGEIVNTWKYPCVNKESSVSSMKT